MAQVLTVHHAGEEWVARDVTGSGYGPSPDLFETIKAAERMARRLGATVNLSREAQNHLFTLGARRAPSPLRVRGEVAGFVSCYERYVPVGMAGNQQSDRVPVRQVGF